MADQGYDAGKREGKIDALKDQQILHASRLDKHDTRIATLEKTAYIVRSKTSWEVNECT